MIRLFGGYGIVSLTFLHEGEVPHLFYDSWIHAFADLSSFYFIIGDNKEVRNDKTRRVACRAVTQADRHPFPDT